MTARAIRDDLTRRVRELLEQHDPSASDRFEFLRARFDSGLAWVHYPSGRGGLGLSREWQVLVDDLLAQVGAPDNAPRRNSIGLGMAAPTLMRFATEAQRTRLLRPLWTGEEVWCQLFSESEAGSDLAAVRTRAEQLAGGKEWRVNGHKVWTSNAHRARWGLLLARTDLHAPKHAGLSYFVCDMTSAGVEVDPLRQITGQAEFNEVFLRDVTLPDDLRLGEVGQGWQVAQATLMSERVAIGASSQRESGLIGVLANSWRRGDYRQLPAFHERLMHGWVEAEVVRLAGSALQQTLGASGPGPEGSVMKVLFARLAQSLSGLEVEMRGEAGLRYADWEMRRSESVDFTKGDAGWRYLRAKGNSIEGGTTEVLLNIIAERVLGLPREPRPAQPLPTIGG